MNRLIAVLIAMCFVCVGCATGGGGLADGTPPDPQLQYPMVGPISPENVAFVDEIIEMATEAGWTFLGMGADWEDDVMMWFSDPDGQCQAFFMIFSQDNTVPWGSCEEALGAWVECVKAKECNAGAFVI